MKEFLKALQEGKKIEMWYDSGGHRGDAFIIPEDDHYVYCFRHESFSDPDAEGRRIKVAESDNCFRIDLKEAEKLLEAWKNNLNARIRIVNS